jgi:hypothetical protein
VQPPKDELESCKLEIGHTQEMLQDAQKAHNKAIAKMYELLRNLLSGDVQSHGIEFSRKMFEARGLLFVATQQV